MTTPTRIAAFLLTSAIGLGLAGTRAAYAEGADAASPAEVKVQGHAVKHDQAAATPTQAKKSRVSHKVGR